MMAIIYFEINLKKKLLLLYKLKIDLLGNNKLKTKTNSASDLTFKLV